MKLYNRELWQYEINHLVSYCTLYKRLCPKKSNRWKYPYAYRRIYLTMWKLLERERRYRQYPEYRMWLKIIREEPWKVVFFSDWLIDNAYTYEEKGFLTMSRRIQRQLEKEEAGKSFKKFIKAYVEPLTPGISLPEWMLDNVGPRNPDISGL